MEVINNERYTPQQIVDMLFATENEKRSLLTFLKELVHTPHKELPMIQSYSIEFTGIDSVSVIVYENKLVGCICYMGSYMYFDRDGLIVESRTEPYEGIPVIDGIQFDQIVLYQKLSVTKEGIFDAVMNLTQLLSVHEIQADKITYDEYDMVTVTHRGCESLSGRQQQHGRQDIRAGGHAEQIRGFERNASFGNLR